MLLSFLTHTEEEEHPPNYLGGLIFLALFGVVFIFIGIRSIKGEVSYLGRWCFKGRIAVRLGWVYIGIGISFIIFGITQLVLSLHL